MKILAIVAALVCAAITGAAIAHTAHPVNLAVRQMDAVDPGASCEPWYTDAGEHHVHSAKCTTTARDIVYCRVDDEHPLAPCQTLIPGPAALVRAHEEAQRAKAGETKPVPTSPPPGPGAAP